MTIRNNQNMNKSKPFEQITILKIGHTIHYSNTGSTCSSHYPGMV